MGVAQAKGEWLRRSPHPSQSLGPVVVVSPLLCGLVGEGEGLGRGLAMSAKFGLRTGWPKLCAVNDCTRSLIVSPPIRPEKEGDGDKQSRRQR